MNNILKRNRRQTAKMSRNQSQNVMSSKTKDFLQKICYKKTASIDMTQYGFINDSKVNPVNLLMKPLREKLEKICGNSSSSSPKKGTPVKGSERGLKKLPKTVGKIKQMKLKRKEGLKKAPSKPVSKKRFPTLIKGAHNNNSPPMN